MYGKWDPAGSECYRVFDAYPQELEYAAQAAKLLNINVSDGLQSLAGGIPAYCVPNDKYSLASPGIALIGWGEPTGPADKRNGEMVNFISSLLVSLDSSGEVYYERIRIEQDGEATVSGVETIASATGYLATLSPGAAASGRRFIADLLPVLINPEPMLNDLTTWANRKDSATHVCGVPRKAWVSTVTTGFTPFALGYAGILASQNLYPVVTGVLPDVQCSPVAGPFMERAASFADYTASGVLATYGAWTLGVLLSYVWQAGDAFSKAWFGDTSCTALLTAWTLYAARSFLAGFLGTSIYQLANDIVDGQPLPLVCGAVKGGSYKLPELKIPPIFQPVPAPAGG